MAQALCDLQLELQTKQSVPPAMASDFLTKTPSKTEPKRIIEKSEAFESSVKEESAELVKPESEFQHFSGTSDSYKESFGDRPDSDFEGIGNFPSPLEISRLDENLLAKRCKLGYRAKRILNLARGVVDGRIGLREMEETCCRERSSRIYSELDYKLKQIHGFGPFTRANVLMCMGFYHVVPSDSETIRHLKQVALSFSSLFIAHLLSIYILFVHIYIA